jgi:hypothetical protein
MAQQTTFFGCPTMIDGDPYNVVLGGKTFRGQVDDKGYLTMAIRRKKLHFTNLKQSITMR